MRISNEIHKPFKQSHEEHLDIVLTVYNIEYCDILSSHTLSDPYQQHRQMANTVLLTLSSDIVNRDKILPTLLE